MVSTLLEINKTMDEASQADTTQSPPNHDYTILNEARQRRARIRARTEEIIHRQSQLTYNNQTMKKEILCWVVALSLVVGLVYYSYLKFYS